MNPYVTLAQKTIKHFLETKQTLELPTDLPADLTNRQAGCFISLHLKPTGELRGCIGTILPTQPTLAEEIIQNAISAAFNDPRFLPLQPEEFNQLDTKADVLSEPEKVDMVGDNSHYRRLDPKKYGVIVRTKDGRCGVLLPDLEGVDTIEQQLAIAGQKAGIDLKTDDYQLQRFSVTRYSDGVDRL